MDSFRIIGNNGICDECERTGRVIAARSFHLCPECLKKFVECLERIKSQRPSLFFKKEEKTEILQRKLSVD